MKIDKAKIKVVEAALDYETSALPSGYKISGGGLPGGYLKLGSCTEQGGVWSGKLMNALGAVHAFYPGLAINGQTETPFELTGDEPYAAICAQLNVPFHFSEILFAGTSAPPGQKAYEIGGKISAIQMDCD